MYDTHYTNGVIAVKEKSLLGEKLLRFSEMKAEEVFRALTESGFGSGSGAESAADSELLCAAEERVLDGFIRTYAPTQAIAEYFLAPRDFHNMKALVKAKKLSVSPEKMLAPMGLIPLETLEAGLENGVLLPKELAEAVKRGTEEELDGAAIGTLFDDALFCRLLTVCRGSASLKKLLWGKIDRKNILTALRSGEEEIAKSAYLSGGKLKENALHAVFSGERDALARTPYEGFYALALREKESGRPFTEAERALDSFETEYFAAHRFELSGKEPFLYYVLCRRAEIANVRILLVSLNAGLSEQEIKKRLRAL